MPPGNESSSSATPLILLISFLTIGYVLGVRYAAKPAAICVSLASLPAWAFIASLRAYGAYNFFAGTVREQGVAGLPGLQCQSCRWQSRAWG